MADIVQTVFSSSDSRPEKFNSIEEVLELKFPRSFSLVSPIISKSHLEKNRIIDKMLRRL